MDRSSVGRELYLADTQRQIKALRHAAEAFRIYRKTRKVENKEELLWYTVAVISDSFPATGAPEVDLVDIFSRRGIPFDTGDMKIRKVELKILRRAWSLNRVRLDRVDIAANGLPGQCSRFLDILAAWHKGEDVVLRQIRI